MGVLGGGSGLRWREVGGRGRPMVGGDGGGGRLVVRRGERRGGGLTGGGLRGEKGMGWLGWVWVRGKEGYFRNFTQIILFSKG